MCKRQDVKLFNMKIVDDTGTRYTDVCEDCARKYNCTNNRKKALDELLRSGLISKEEYEAKTA